MNARPIGLELKRGTGLLLLVAVLATGTLMTLMTLLVRDATTEWSASGPGILRWLNTTTLILGPLAAAAGAWFGARERRLRVEELLAVVPRPRWQRDAASLSALSAALTAGLLGVAAVVAATVAPALSYGGGRWPLSLLMLTLGLVCCLTVGFAAGRLSPHRWTAPLVGLAVYLTGGVPGYFHTAPAQLAPIANLPSGDGQQVRLWVAGLALCWLLALSTAAVLIGAARRRRWALLPLAVAVLAAAPLVPLPTQWTGNSYAAAWTEADPGALAPVCTTDMPKVCLNRVHAPLLPEVTRLARSVLAELPAGHVAVERGLEHPAYARARPGELQIPLLEGYTEPFSTELRDPERLRWELVTTFLVGSCPVSSPAAERAYDVATTVVYGPGAPEDTAGADREPLTQRLRAAPVARRAWLADYVEAVQTCDAAAFDRLLRS